MISLSRWTMGIPTIMFAAFHALLGILALSRYTNLWPVFLAMVLYMAACILSIILYKNLHMPVGQAVANLAICLAVPLLVNSVLPSSSLAVHDTWYVEAVATLLAITAVRGHNWFALVGFLALCAEVIAWGGFQTIFSNGLVGAGLLIFAGAAASLGFTRLNEQIDELEERERDIQKQTAALQIAGSQRASLLNEMLHGALPYVKKVASGATVTGIFRDELIDVVDTVRDGLAGRRLVDDEVHRAVKEARQRGVEVVFAVANQLDGCSEEDIVQYRLRLIEELDQVNSGRVIIRSIAYGALRVSFMVTQHGDPKPLKAIRF